MIEGRIAETETIRRRPGVPLDSACRWTGVHLFV
jgi:hypothetical protein